MNINEIYFLHTLYFLSTIQYIRASLVHASRPRIQPLFFFGKHTWYMPKSVCYDASRSKSAHIITPRGTIDTDQSCSSCWQHSSSFQPVGKPSAYLHLLTGTLHTLSLASTLLDSSFTANSITCTKGISCRFRIIIKNN